MAGSGDFIVRPSNGRDRQAARIACDMKGDHRGFVMVKKCCSMLLKVAKILDLEQQLNVAQRELSRLK
jgi:hypothetical protein